MYLSSPRRSPLRGWLSWSQFNYSSSALDSWSVDSNLQLHAPPRQDASSSRCRKKYWMSG